MATSWYSNREQPLGIQIKIYNLFVSIYLSIYLYSFYNMLTFFIMQSNRELSIK
uniref:Transmembrane protein n=1 Tax=Medicago truncatula TaxID=3880 RepID=I3SE67_MEDTR|nr:unknown [Medicago truncatula]